MALNGVDISSYQSGINLAALPCDFAIVKATEGTGYTNPDCDRAMQQLFACGKCAGVYHYINGASGEIDYFVNNVRGYIGKSILCLDWESGGNGAWGNQSYLESCVNRVKDLTGITPIVYASASTFPWDVCSRTNAGAWVAQYASNNATGYQDSPWNESNYNMAIFQYSSNGRLDGWGGSLDLDKFYGDADTWAAYAESEDDMTPNDVWSFTNGGESGTVYRNLIDNNLRLQDLQNTIGERSGGNGSIFTNAIDTNLRIQQLQVTVNAMAETIKTLANAKGADADAIAKQVQDAVAKKLSEIQLHVTTDGK